MKLGEALFVIQSIFPQTQEDADAIMDKLEAYVQEPGEDQLDMFAKIGEATAALFLYALQTADHGQLETDYPVEEIARNE